MARSKSVSLFVFSLLDLSLIGVLENEELFSWGKGEVDPIEFPLPDDTLWLTGCPWGRKCPNASIKLGWFLKSLATCSTTCFVSILLNRTI